MSGSSGLTEEYMRAWQVGAAQNLPSAKSLALPGPFLRAPNPPSVLGALFGFGGQPGAAMYSFTIAVRGYLCCRKLLQ